MYDMRGVRCTFSFRMVFSTFATRGRIFDISWCRDPFNLPMSSRVGTDRETSTVVQV